MLFSPLCNFLFLSDLKKVGKSKLYNNNERAETKLPPGFQFNSTDQELLLHYLKPKVFILPLPASFIPEINLKKYIPWDLSGNIFFFNFFNLFF
jgi:No apical meristem (NAM) protein